MDGLRGRIRAVRIHQFARWERGQRVKIRDLPRPVTAAKADWLAASNWIGFTPPTPSLHSREQRRTAINHQIRNGYVIEYITRTIDQPNEGFETDPQYLADRERHRPLAGKLIAVHRLIPSALPLQQIVGESSYKHMQDMWARRDRRHRWSIAFPVVESFSIPAQPRASDILSEQAMKRVFAHASGTLRPLNDDERSQIADIEIKHRYIENPWLAIDAEFEMASGSEISGRFQRMMDQDLGALEGMTTEQRRKVRVRAAWKAEAYARRLWREGLLRCEECGFDPILKAKDTSISPRTLIDVHHKHPLEEGQRLTTDADFAVLCPTCHRFVHALGRT